MKEKESDLIQNRWEKRATTHKSSLRGVLFQGLPEPINSLLNQWHISIIKKHVLTRLTNGAQLIDIGSGYGRLSQYSQEFRPDIGIVGLDFSITYCKVFRNNIGNSVCASVEHLPFSNEIWDGALVVTTLMYLPEDKSQIIVEDIMDTIKPGGIALFIDPGMELIHLLRKFNSKTAEKTTGGDGFTNLTYRSLFDHDDYLVVAQGSNMLFTFLLPVLLLLSRFPLILRPLGNLIITLENALVFPQTYALHRWLVVRRVR